MDVQLTATKGCIERLLHAAEPPRKWPFDLVRPAEQTEAHLARYARVLESIAFALDYVGVLDRIETIAHSFLKVNQCTWKERLRLLEG
jgi:hypothetical protein